MGESWGMVLQLQNYREVAICRTLSIDLSISANSLSPHGFGAAGPQQKPGPSHVKIRSLRVYTYVPVAGYLAGPRQGYPACREGGISGLSGDNPLKCPERQGRVGETGEKDRDLPIIPSVSTICRADTVSSSSCASSPNAIPVEAGAIPLLPFQTVLVNCEIPEK